MENKVKSTSCFRKNLILRVLKVVTASASFVTLVKNKKAPPGFLTSS